jgi:4-hydroxybutyrate CoA-transferase
MDYRAMYQSKLVTKEAALDLVKSNDRIMVYGGANVFLEGLCERSDKLENVELYTMFMLNQDYPFLNGKTKGHITHYGTFLSPPMRKAAAAGHPQGVILTHYSDTDALVQNRIKPTFLFVQCTPMDDEGYFTMGFNSLGHMVGTEIAERIVVQVNPRLPRILGECNRLPVSKVTAIFEEEAQLYTAPKKEVFDQTDYQAASLIAERIPNGATLQIGVGRIPDAVGNLLDNHKDLGVHTEMFSVSLMNLMKKGVINNSKKTVKPGKTVFAFAGGQRATQEIYDYVDNNDLIEMNPISWVNDPYVVARLENFISINSAIAVDLTGQVCSESIGLKTFSGPGGQCDFIRGARLAPGGQSYILINSTGTKKDGTRFSKITLALPTGSAVTASRADVHNIVTEYGVAELRFRSLEERAKAMISIAHPDFRDQLTYEAKKAGYFD